MTVDSQSYTLPILPLKKLIAYPDLALPISFHQATAVKALDYALSTTNKMVAAFTLLNPDVKDPHQNDFYHVGMSGNIQLISRFGTTIQIILRTLERVEIIDFLQISPFLKAQVKPLPLIITSGVRKEALQREILDLTGKFFSLSHPEKNLHLPSTVENSENIMQLIYPVATLLQLDQEKGQPLLEAPTDCDAMEIFIPLLTHEIQVLEIRKKYSDKAQDKLNDEHRKYLIREQIQALQDELGENSNEIESDDLERKLKESHLPEHIRSEAEKEFSRLRKIPSTSPEHQVAMTHLELILDLPWEKATTDNLDLNNAKQVLDEDHYDLKEIKDRIIEQLAVMILNPKAKAPILCFIGPPGVGKTSLGQSIARALGRKFDRFSLGGLHDEAELRGHRRTYIGAMPGRVIQAIRRAGASNPLIMLDEIDKLGRDFRGDPSAALMEILDPAQNNSFHDNYLDLPFDLSKIFFITTANTIDNIPRPLLDRMEMLRLSGYSDEEKIEIALRYLLPRQRNEAGLSPELFVVPEATLASIIRRYTREAGVRELERMIGRLARKVAVKFAQGETKAISINSEDLAEFLGPERFFVEKLRQQLSPGVATGLAWTETGGDVLYIEAIKLSQGDKLTLTGHLGEVMKESAIAANSYILSKSSLWGFENQVEAVHLHVPAGAIPKDGPSAGVTMAAALASLYSDKAVRGDSAMTGEITLSGLVLPVGGIKEKVLAARRAGIYRVVLPSENKKDLSDLPDPVIKEMEFIFVDHIEDVLSAVIPELSLGKPSS